MTASQIRERITKLERIRPERGSSPNEVEAAKKAIDNLKTRLPAGREFPQYNPAFEDRFDFAKASPEPDPVYEYEPTIETFIHLMRASAVRNGILRTRRAR